MVIINYVKFKTNEKEKTRGLVNPRLTTSHSCSCTLCQIMVECDVWTRPMFCIAFSYDALPKVRYFFQWKKVVMIQFQKHLSVVFNMFELNSNSLLKSDHLKIIRKGGGRY